VTSANPNNRSSTGAYATRQCPNRAGVDDPRIADPA
jgi:hypothetical protein